MLEFTKKNDITEFVFILDRSGSMSGLEEDTIGGFNSMISRQKKEDRRTYVTTVLFDDQMKTIHDRVLLSNIEKMTDRDYYVGGSTALLDAIGETIEKIKMIHKYIRPEDVPSKTVFMITTDGMENASVKYSSNQIKKMIKAQEEIGWEFLFIGANIDAIETAGTFGIRRSNAVNYRASSTGTRAVYEDLANVMECVIENDCMPEEMFCKTRMDYAGTDDWCDDEDDDFDEDWDDDFDSEDIEVIE